MNPLRFLFASLFVFSACSSAAPNVDLSGAWPTAPLKDEKAYYDTTEEWTRRGQVLSDFSERKQQVLEVFATLKSPKWNAAYIDFVSRRKLLPESEKQVLRQAAEGADHVEFAIFMSVDDRRSNDLHRGDRSTWRIALVDDLGNETLPIEVVRVRRPQPVIRTEFPHFTQFHTVYLARFPVSATPFGRGKKRVTLKLASSRGGVQLEWRASN